MDIIMPVWAIDPETINVTEAAVESLRSSAPESKLIIIDNGSAVGGGQLREWADLYVRNKENLGYAKAVNQGLKLSGEWVAVANNDIRVSPNWVDTTNEILNRVEGVGTLHFRMTTYEEEFKYGDTVFITGRERWNTGSFFVMRNHWKFDEQFLNSYDDWDLQTRVRQDGFKTVYTTRASYQHLDSFTQRKIVDVEREARNQKNREYYKSKHGEYPEDLYTKQFPEQMSQDWRSKFDEL